MAKLTKRQRSNKAHQRLRAKYASMPGRNSEIKFFYHNEVIKRQHNRVLSRSEKAKIYKDVASKVR